MSVNAVFVATGFAGIVLAGRLVIWPLANVTVPRRVETASSVAPEQPEMYPDSVVAKLTSHDPFRVSRRPSSIAYDPVRLMQSLAPPAAKPVLSLIGIVWDRGNDPTALVEGLPGVDGARPMRLGETVGGLRMKSIKVDRVVITGLDTTWTLAVREPWK